MTKSRFESWDTPPLVLKVWECNVPWSGIPSTLILRLKSFDNFLANLEVTWMFLIFLLHLNKTKQSCGFDKPFRNFSCTHRSGVSIKGPDTGTSVTWSPKLHLTKSPTSLATSSPISNLRGRFHGENEEVEEEDEQPTPVSENNTRSCHPGELDMNGIRFSARRYCPPLKEELQWIVTSIC